ncbi:MAG: MBL fold metallo-hydrolase [Alphaproteobacteria bacterium]|nr:MBL fold metallo-hydrolase [Alphaproteobacteria bacterium]
MSFKVKFWGVRGSIACPSPRHVAFGGNTSCVEVSAAGHRLILDAGTGIRNLGHWLQRKEISRATLLLSHTHWDHINGFPFFSPAFSKKNEFVIMAGHVRQKGGIEKVLAGTMAQPTFPVPLEMMASELRFVDFDAGDTLDLHEGVRVRTTVLNHPNGATGYRVEHGGRSVCYITDTEHVVGSPDQNILALIEGSELVIYDATYTDREFQGRIGWGHSTWEEGVRLCRAANVKTLAIFHHDPDHDDGFMEQIEADARNMWAGAIVARENMRFNLV